MLCRICFAAAIVFMTVATVQSRDMVCGEGVAACGVLALMTGLGSGVQNVSGGAVYGHPFPVVHGLWPQTPPYGNSECLAPGNATPPTTVCPCYTCAKGDTNCSSTKGHSPLEFEVHEFGKHGICAGIANAEDFFGQVCALSAQPLDVLKRERAAGTRALSDFTKALEAEANHTEVFYSNEHTMEVYLSACRNQATGKWVLAPSGDFAKWCSGK